MCPLIRVSESLQEMPINLTILELVTNYLMPRNANVYTPTKNEKKNIWMQTFVQEKDRN